MPSGFAPPIVEPVFIVWLVFPVPGAVPGVY